MRLIIAGYVLSIVLAEAIGVVVSPAVGAAAHAALIVLLAAHYAWGGATPYRRLLPVLLLPSLLRVLSLALPSRDVPQLYWYVLAGLPVLVAAGLAAWQLRLAPGRLGLGLRSDWVQAAIALSGLPLALLAYFILRPAPLVTGAGWPLLLLAAVILVIFAAFLEEFIFRGLVLHATRDVLGRRGALVASSLLFAALYLGALSPQFLLLIGLVGLYFGLCVERTGSLWGVTIAHSVMVVGLVLVLPLVATSIH